MRNDRRHADSVYGGFHPPLSPLPSKGGEIKKYPRPLEERVRVRSIRFFKHRVCILQLWILTFALFVFAYYPSTAFAHVQQGEATGFLTGLRHPISGLDHVLAMVAVGLWGAQLGAPAIWLLPVAFPMVMAMGAMLGLMGLPLPGIEYGIAASAILLGAAVMFEVRPPLAAAAILVGFFAIFHGHAHGTELPPGQSALLYSMGFVMATGCLHAVGIGIGTVHRWSWGQTVLRVAGAVVAMGGIFFMWKAIV